MKAFFNIFVLVVGICALPIAICGFAMPGSYVDKRNCGVVEFESADVIPHWYELNADPEVRCRVARVKK